MGHPKEPKGRGTGSPRRLPVADHIRNALRQVWSRYSEEKRQVLLTAKVEIDVHNKDGSVSKKPGARYTCFQCMELFKRDEVQVDHIQAVGAFPKGIRSNTDMVYVAMWIQGLFCGVENLQVLCKPCHKEKTKDDVRKIRQQQKSSKTSSN